MTIGHRVFTAFAFAFALAAATPALAGPPLLCHPYEIGSARSLPWDGKAGWSPGRTDYPLQQRAAAAEASLQPGTPVIAPQDTPPPAATHPRPHAAVAAARPEPRRVHARARRAHALLARNIDHVS